MPIHSFRDLKVWQKAMDLSEEVYKLTKELPASELYGLVSQLQRCSVSIPSNIAEGCQRNNRNEFKHFCGIAYGSAAELETQLLLIERIHKTEIREVLLLLTEVQKMLRQLIHKLSTKN